MFIHTHVRYFIFLFFQFKLGWGFLQVQIWGAGVVKICTEKHVHVYIYIQYNGFVLFWFQSGWGFYCTQIWGYVAGGDKICSCEFFILNILRNMVGRQKYKIQKCMINPNDLIRIIREQICNLSFILYLPSITGCGLLGNNQMSDLEKVVSMCLPAIIPQSPLLCQCLTLTTFQISEQDQ